MKFRILLRSFDNDLINLACQQLRSTLTKTECKVSGVVSLPTKIKRFCVLRSPHVDKDSREHFEIRIYKRFIDITTCGERNTQKRLIFVGNETTPLTLHSVLLNVERNC
jgi:small subunit ribosomal protein S10